MFSSAKFVERVYRFGGSGVVVVFFFPAASFFVYVALLLFWRPAFVSFFRALRFVER